MQGITPYSRWGNLPILTMSLLFFVIGIALKARQT
jgi:apolipoprotein N-acyltransferase